MQIKQFDEIQKDLNFFLRKFRSFNPNYTTKTRKEKRKTRKEKGKGKLKQVHMRQREGDSRIE